jgi:hypothetical protein
MPRPSSTGTKNVSMLALPASSEVSITTAPTWYSPGWTHGGAAGGCRKDAKLYAS